MPAFAGVTTRQSTIARKSNCSPLQPAELSNNFLLPKQVARNLRLEKLSRYNVLLLVTKIRKIHTLRKTLKTDSKTDWSGGEQLRQILVPNALKSLARCQTCTVAIAGESL